MRLVLAPKDAVVEEDTAAAGEDEVVVEEAKVAAEVDMAVVEEDEGAADEDQTETVASNHPHSTHSTRVAKI
jgi:predicted  nucleic acid-binding Zn-ribbon protein